MGVMTIKEKPWRGEREYLNYLIEENSLPVREGVPIRIKSVFQVGLAAYTALLLKRLSPNVFAKSFQRVVTTVYLYDDIRFVKDADETLFFARGLY